MLFKLFLYMPEFENYCFLEMSLEEKQIMPMHLYKPVGFSKIIYPLL